MVVRSNPVEGGSLGQPLGRYQQVAKLGQGGMGSVYLALASGFGQFRKLLVVKELRQDLTRQRGFVQLFMNEAKLAARLSHPNVVQTFEAFQEGQRYLLAMEYLDGQSLSALISRCAGEKSGLTLDMHIHILCAVLAGLQYAHQLRDFDGSSLHVVHRDVSPQNVFVTYHGEVKVVDFGVAKAANAMTSTAPGVFMGKFGYAAPEQLLGGPVDGRTDVFSVGVMLWQAIARRRFSTGKPTTEAVRARAEGTEPRIRAVVPGVDEELAEICDRAMAADPDQRFASAEQLRVALLSYLETRDTRVHDTDIGTLMQRAFEAEREALHAQIVSAVHVDSPDSNVEALPFLAGDKEPTTVADLSDYVDVSLQREDQKIREAYASTKVTRLPSTRAPEASRPLSAAATRPRLWASLLLVGVLALVVLLWTSRHDNGGVQAKALAPAQPSPQTDSVQSIVTSVQLPSDPFKPTAPASPASEGVSNLAPTPAAATPASKASTATVPRPRARPTPTRAEREAPRPESAPEPTVVSAPPAGPAQPKSGRVSAGSDLGSRRSAAPERLDFDNPYHR